MMAVTIRLSDIISIRVLPWQPPCFRSGCAVDINGVTSPDDVREALQSTAEDKGAPGRDPAYGWGIVDAYAALQFSFGPKPPVADAGSDQTLSDADNDTVEAVILDGSASYDPDGSITAYEWMEGGTVLGTAEVITCNFNVGTHSVT
ncbi:MAG TPA: hypothetical protein ENF23_07215, partial [Methanosarcinales archaeon]|nr:hypothetical protein [Methanosarcinales archaeon]